MKRWAIFCAVAGMTASAASEASAQSLPAYQANAAWAFPGATNRYNDPLGAPRNVCFSAAALHRWCRVFVTASGGPCVCGAGAGGAGVFAGTLITDAQLYELIGEDVKQAEVGANGRRLANSRNYNGF